MADELSGLTLKPEEIMKKLLTRPQGKGGSASWLFFPLDPLLSFPYLFCKRIRSHNLGAEEL